METKNIDKIDLLACNSRKLKTLVEEYLPDVRKKARDPQRGYGCVDKHNDGFALDDNRGINMKLAYSSSTGTYGDSSVYTDLSGLDDKIFKDYFLKYLNAHKDEILMEMAALMDKDKQNYKEAALGEIERIKAKIEEVGNEL